MKSSGARYTIGEVAGQFGLATHVLRHWESMGLLSPSRTSAGERVYRRADHYRVATILQAKQAGIPLEDVRALLRADQPAERSAILHHHQAVLTDRISRARNALALIETALSCQHGDLATCPTFRSHLAEVVDAPNGWLDE